LHPRDERLPLFYDGFIGVPHTCLVLTSMILHEKKNSSFHISYESSCICVYGIYRRSKTCFLERNQVKQSNRISEVTHRYIIYKSIIILTHRHIHTKRYFVSKGTWIDDVLLMLCAIYYSQSIFIIFSLALYILLAYSKN